MPNKPGMGGHGHEAYDPNTGKFIEDGKPNVRHPNPVEAQKIAGGVSPMKIKQDSAASMSAPTPNLGDYAKPKKEQTPTKQEVLQKEYGVEYSDRDTFAPYRIDDQEMWRKLPEGSDIDDVMFRYTDNYKKNLADYVRSVYPNNGLSEERYQNILKSGEVPYNVLDELGMDEEELSEEFNNYFLDNIA